MATNNALNNMNGTVTTTARSNSTTYTLTAGSSNIQQFTDPSFASGDAVQLPVVSTLMLGRQFTIINGSQFSSLPVNSSGGNSVLSIGIQGSATFTCIAITGTTAASWLVSTTNNGFSSWTPTVTFSTPGNLSVSYSAQSGSYFIVGKFCWINLDLRFTPTYTTSSGTLIVQGFPLTLQNLSNPGYGGILVQNGFPGGVVAAFPYPASTTFIVPQIPGGTSNMVLGAMGSGTDISLLGTVQFPSGTARYFRLQFLTLLA